MTIRRSLIFILGLTSIQNGPPYSSSVCCIDGRQWVGWLRTRPVAVPADDGVCSCGQAGRTRSERTSSLIVGAPAYLSPAGTYPAVVVVTAHGIVRMRGNQAEYDRTARASAFARREAHRAARPPRTQLCDLLLLALE